MNLKPETWNLKPLSDIGLWTLDSSATDRWPQFFATILYYGEEAMQELNQTRFDGVMDHIAVESDDLQRDVEEYQRIGFQLETLYDDWAMLRDARGFGIALLAPGSKHPPHFGLRVETREALQQAAAREGRPIKEHRDRSVSFYTRGVGGNNVEVIYYPPEYGS